jgi:hypothetical protein
MTRGIHAKQFMNPEQTLGSRHYIVTFIGVYRGIFIDLETSEEGAWCFYEIALQG